MAQTAPRVRTCLWVRERGLEAATFYAGLLPDSRVDVVLEGENPDDPLLVNFTLAGTPYQVLAAAGHDHDLTPATSISVATEGQGETDRLRAALLEGGGSEMACGWLTDRYGLSWQIVPRRLSELLSDPDSARAGRAMRAMQTMIEIDIAAFSAAANTTENHAAEAAT